MQASEFKEMAKANGFPEPIAKTYEKNMSNDMHTHDFTATLLITEGQFTVTTEDGAVVHTPGDVCTVKAGTLHCEAVGEEGAAALVSKKPA